MLTIGAYETTIIALVFVWLIFGPTLMTVGVAWSRRFKDRWRVLWPQFKAWLRRQLR